MPVSDAYSFLQGMPGSISVVYYKGFLLFCLLFGLCQNTATMADSLATASSK
jgi:hypothetical protein